MLSKIFFLPFYKFSYFAVLFFILLTTGCTFIAKIDNKPVSQIPSEQERYSATNFNKEHPVGETMLFLAFSGGGTRAATLSYGLLEELRDTQFQENGQTVRLLDEVDRISSVSGGSFTSAYYGLFGDQIFEDFKDVFLYMDVQKRLSDRIFDLFKVMNRIFTKTSRTEIAIDYYDKHIFRGKTFADIQNSGGPMILINASDLNSRGQFLFIQTQFDFLCSDLSEFKVARAVAASSAVPVLFQPILIERYGDCHYQEPKWLSDAEKRAIQEGDKRLKETVSSYKFYLNKENPPYATLLDGGVTDNLGLRTILRSVSVLGDANSAYKHQKIIKPPKRMVVIVVNASTSNETDIGKSRIMASLGDTLSTVTDMQLHLYNTETNSLMKEELIQWAKNVSTKEFPVVPYLIELDASGIKNPDERMYFNRIPTSFSLKKEQVDNLIETVKRLLRQNPEYQKLLKDMGAGTVN